MIRIVRILSFFGAILLSDFAHTLEPECLSWFKVGKISPESANCVARCSSLKVDLGTFYCPQRCEELCHPQKDGCDELKAKLRKSFSNGRPSKWEQESEKSKTWNGKEKDRVVESLLKLPTRLLKLDGVRLYRMSKSVHQGNPASNLESSIALYDEAFSDKEPLERVLEVAWEKFLPGFIAGFITSSVIA